MIKKYFALVALLTTLFWPQYAHAFGEWETYNATPSMSRLQFFGNRLYAIAGSSLCSFSTDTLNVDFQQLNRTEGLNGTTVQYLLTVPEANSLAIAYANGNLDIMSEDGVIHNIPDLANKSMSGDKTLYGIMSSGKQLFVCGGFGFLIVDLPNYMITQSYLTRFPVKLAFQWGDRLYRYSDLRGLEYGLLAENLAEDRKWHRCSTTRFAKSLCFGMGEKSYCWLLDEAGKLYELTDSHEIVELADKGFKDLSVIDDKVFLPTCSQAVYLTQPDSHIFTPNTSDPFCHAYEYVTAGQPGHFFMLANSSTILRASLLDYQEGVNAPFEGDWTNLLKPTGQTTEYLGEMQLTEYGLVGIARRSYVSGYAEAHALPGVLATLDAESGHFKNIAKNELQAGHGSNLSFAGLTGLAIDPLHEERYAISSGMNGVYVIDHDTLLCCYDQLTTQGGIQAFDPTFASTRTNAVAYDDDGNLFVANSMQDTVLRCLTPKGEWLKFANPGMAKVAEARRILISQHDDYGFKWVLNDYGYQKSRVGIYYDGGTLEKMSDDKATYFSTLLDQDYNEYVPYYMYDLCEDLDGKVWVLTSNGPFVIEDPKATFDYAQKNTGMGKVRRVKIPRNDGTNLADYLMESTPCVCMAIDNFNRKWIGTFGAGLYLMSEDCIHEIAHFTTDNSPLLSNDILSLCYDPVSGILYISCQGGVLSYQTDAIEGESDFEDIHCYPNPVRPEFAGQLNIMGLMNDSQVTITTTSGELVYRTHSEGAIATWDLRKANGARVDPGIYLIHGVNASEGKGKICKFLVL